MISKLIFPIDASRTNEYEICFNIDKVIKSSQISINSIISKEEKEYLESLKSDNIEQNIKIFILNKIEKLGISCKS